MKYIKCSVKNIAWATQSVMTLTCQPCEPYYFRAGQYTMLKTNNMPEPRAYSIATLEDNEILEFHIRKTKPISPTIKELVSLNTGDTIFITPAIGNNVLDKTSTEPLTLIAGGVGISPLYSMIISAYKHMPKRIVSLYWGGDNKDDLYLHQKFLELANSNEYFSYIPACLKKHKDIGCGYITDFLAESTESIEKIQASKVHIAGPKAMMIKTINILTANEVSEEKLFYDKFW